MSKYDMCEALYALPGGVVVKRRKPIAMPAVLLVAGVALLIINSQIEASAEMMNLKSALVLFGAVATVVGAVILVLRMMGGAGAPYHAADGCYLKCKELKFNKEKSAQLRDLVNRGDFTTLRSLPEDGVSAVTVVMYSSPRSGFCAAQVFEYFELELRAVSQLRVTDK
ncbi:MAG: hypothetical protein IIX20_03000 [Alistipes sp.]|nr:hypothetical protein [Alistipes sp.]